jgi:hypothetical protein
MNLEQSALSLREQFPGAPRLDLERQERMLEKFGTFAFGGFGIVLAFAILTFIYLIFSKMVLSGEQPFFGIVLTAFMIFSALTLAYVIWNETLKEKRQKLQAKRLPNEAVSGPAAAPLLENPHFEPVPSVTEDTTELLAVKRKTKEL